MFRVCPLGKDGLVSYGGTASACGGRARPAASLPTDVISSDPAVATSISTTGVHERHHHASASVTTVAMIGMTAPLPRLVNAVTTASPAGVRCATIHSSIGSSILARPVLSRTAS